MKTTNISKYKQRTDETTKEHIKQLTELHVIDKMPKILLLGDSLFERFKTMTGEPTKIWTDNGFDKLDIFNAGIGGDQIQNVLYRITEQKILTYLGKSIKKIILMIGANNIENDKPLDMIKGVKTIIGLIRDVYPLTPLYVLGIPPRKRSSSKAKNNEDLLKKIKEYNKLLESLPEKYVDTYELFVDKDGKMNDNLFVDVVHFNDEGYLVYANLLKKLFEP